MRSDQRGRLQLEVGEELGKVRNWHGENMEIICQETANDRRYKYIYAIAVAVKYILGWIERQESGKNAE